MKEDFGHHPDPNPLMRNYCARCRKSVQSEWTDEHGASRRSLSTTRMTWPCTSAIVLGLVPRPRNGSTN